MKLALPILIWCAQAAAENTLVDRAIYGAQHGDVCAKLEKPELAACFGTKSVAPTASAYTLLKTAAFERAADRQIQIDGCIAEQARGLLTNPGALQSWRGIVGQAWLGQRKAQLMLTYCRANFSDQIPPAVLEKLGPDGAFEELARLRRFIGARGKVSPEVTEARIRDLARWKDICLDRETMNALAQAKSLFLNTIPNLGTADLFDDIDKHRAVFLNKRTGKPLSDTDLLGANLTDLKFVRMQPSTELNAVLSKRLEDAASAREDSVRTLGHARVADGQFLLSETQRQYIYDDGTLTDVLGETLGPGTYSVAAGCLAAHYTRSVSGEMVKLALGTLASGGVATALLRGTKTFQTLSALGKIKRVAGTGFALAGTVQSAARLFQACKTGRLNRDGSVKSRQDFTAGADLPEDLNFVRYSQEIPRKPGSACGDKVVQSTVLRMNSDANCLHALLWEGLPLATGIPGL